MEQDEANAAAERGDPGAQCSLGWQYLRGDGVPKDYAKAEGWFRKSAAQGSADAQFNLGLMFHRGEGVAQDYEEAMAWFEKAAELGNADAHFQLGLMFLHGEGEPTNNLSEAAAAVKFINAAELGHVPA